MKGNGQLSTLVVHLLASHFTDWVILTVWYIYWHSCQWSLNYHLE